VAQVGVGGPFGEFDLGAVYKVQNLLKSGAGGSGTAGEMHSSESFFKLFSNEAFGQFNPASKLAFSLSLNLILPPAVQDTDLDRSPPIICATCSGRILRKEPLGTWHFPLGRTAQPQP
jgi:hypothetical protein